MKVSLLVITLNEETNLERCLDSAKDLVDEIVVIDSGSTDDTRGIAELHRAVWVDQPWLGYVRQKNVGLERCANDWVLSLDADEALSAHLKKEISIIKSAPEPSISGYSFPRCVFFEGKWIRHGDWYPDRLVRLFKRSKAEFRGDKVHERLHLEGEVEPLNGEIEHYSFKSDEDQKNRMTHYSELWAESQFEKGNRPGILSEYTHAFWSFFRGFFLRAGFMDGQVGLTIAKTNASGVYFKYSRLRAMWKAK